jgi:Flp pilus assembly protein TadG
VAIVEFALVLSLVIMVIFGMIDFGNLFNDSQNLRQGVREAAREAATNPDQYNAVTDPNAQAEFQQLVISRTGLSANRLTVGWTPSGPLSQGSYLKVCVAYQVKSITGVAAVFLPSTVHATEYMRLELPATKFPTSPNAIC